MTKGKNSYKRSGGLVLSLAVLVLVTIFSIEAPTAAAADAKPVELKWAVFVTQDLHSMPPLIQWTEDIEAQTKGAVKIKLYFAGEIAETKDLVHLCRTGSIDVISTPPVYYTGLFPLNAVLQTYYPIKQDGGAGGVFLERTISRRAGDPGRI